jgi:hypothetical protein
LHLAITCLLVVGYPVLVLGLMAAAYALYRGHWRRVVSAAFALLAVAWVAAMVFLRAESGTLLLGTCGLVALGSCLYVTCRRRPRARSSKPRPEPGFVPTPTARPIRPQDLVGNWSFYLDDAAVTVRLEFRPDGTFAQSLVSNRGERTECPGGTWTLDGPHVELVGYQSAAAGTIERVRWLFADTPAGLSLFGKDHPSLEKPLRQSRVD